MSKQDWLEYFEAVNERSATEEEIAQAMLSGEFLEAEQANVDQVINEGTQSSSTFNQPQQELQGSEPPQQPFVQQQNFQQPFAQQSSQQYQEVPQQQ